MTDGEPTSDTVRVRGIYATALTKRLADSGMAVVDPSPTISKRFDQSFDDRLAAAWIETTRDRQGIGIHGDDGTVATVRDTLADVGIDTVTVAATAPVGGLYAGLVSGESRSGAIVDLGEREGYLPYDASDDYVETGDALRVQIHDPRAPWGEQRPEVRPEIAARGRYLHLVRGVDTTIAATPRNAAEGEFEQLTSLLDVSIPEQWGIRWRSPAQEVPIDLLDDALSRAASQAVAVEETLADFDAENVHRPQLLAAPHRTAWMWFGRSSRFQLDDDRATVTTTVPGHHRIKAGTASASAAVDFVERLGVSVEEFPFAAVVEQFGPAVGDEVDILHGKPDGRRHSLGRGEVVEQNLEDQSLTIKRNITSTGTYDGLEVPRTPGDTATTQLAEGRWWFPTVYRDEDGDRKGTYVNVCTPVELFPGAVVYLDLHVDVVKRPDGTVDLLDVSELEHAREAGHLSDALATRARDVADRLTDVLS